jgi:hypothetical protein
MQGSRRSTAVVRLVGERTPRPAHGCVGGGRAPPSAHAEALGAVVGAAEACGVEELWSLGDMVGGGPDAERVVRRTRERCTVALVGITTTARPGRSIWCGQGSAGRGVAVARAGARAAVRRGDRWLQAGGAPRRRPVLAWRAAQRRLGERRIVQCRRLPRRSARRAWAGRPHARPCRVAANAARRPPRQVSAGRCRWTSPPASGC